MSNWMIEAFIASSLLMLFVLLIRKSVATEFGARTAYWLWLLPALRMIMPPLPSTWMAAPMDRLPTPLPDIVTDIQFAATPVAVDLAWNWGLVFVILWAGGAMCHFAAHLWAYRQFADRATTNAELLREINPGAIQLLATHEVNGPLAMGVRRPAILVPADFEWRYDVQEREFAIAHEVAHHRRGDLKVNFGALALLSLHWFNPLAHMAYRAFRTDQELACDATIMAGADGEARHAYGRALVKSACDRAPLATCALNRKQELKRRLRMMRFGALSPVRSAAATIVALGLLGGGLLLTASVGANAAAETKVGRLVQDAVDGGGAVATTAIIDTAEAMVAEDDRGFAAVADRAEQDARLAEARAKQAEVKLGQKLTAGKLSTTEYEAIDAEYVAVREAAREARHDAGVARRDALEAQRDAMVSRRDAADAEREASDEARQARLESEQDAAEAAREAAEDARSGARQALIEARAAQGQAERTARRGSRFSWKGQMMPTPPVPPVPLAPPAPPVPPSPSKHHASSCNGEGSRAVSRIVTRSGDNAREFVHVTACPNVHVRVDQNEVHKAALTALKSARIQISTLVQLNDAQKGHALRSIDAEIAALERRTR
jgi:bla regulator protein blaR1